MAPTSARCWAIGPVDILNQETAHKAYRVEMAFDNRDTRIILLWLSALIEVPAWPQMSLRTCSRKLPPWHSCAAIKCQKLCSQHLALALQESCRCLRS